jgi:ectoine hydroxylase-related dioxygenase (phytanoyl-CoA dioxygenase family)
VFERLVRDSPMADIAQGLFRGSPVWYHNEQLWLKEGGSGRRTPWHQDAGYERMEGSKILNLWVPLDPLAACNVLEVIRGSHKGPLYNPPNYDPTDDTAPTYDDPGYPRMPDIEREREKWDVFATAMDRGDVLAFHHAAIHGGAPVFEGQRRRSFTFRFFGDDARIRSHGRRVSSASGGVEFREENLAVGVRGLKPGDPASSSPEFRRVRPWTSA